MKIRKALIPCAGLGTRLLPATKVVPKELFPIFNRPAVEYVVDELVASGIEEIVFVLHPSKQSVLNHFFRGGFVEDSLKLKGKLDDFPAVTKYHETPRFRVAYQFEAKGLGHAVLCGQHEIGTEPFVVVLPDDIIRSDVPATRQLIQACESTGKYAVAVMEVSPSETQSYGIIQGNLAPHGGHFDIQDLVEKPKPQEAPSRMAVIGRYVLPPDIFSSLEDVKGGALGEIQLTDALRVLASRGDLIGVPFEGQRIDTGQPHGFVEANLIYAFDDPVARAHLIKVVDELGKVR